MLDDSGAGDDGSPSGSQKKTEQIFSSSAPLLHRKSLKIPDPKFQKSVFHVCQKEFLAEINRLERRRHVALSH